MSLNIDDRVYAPDDDEPAPCMWFALCNNPANGLRDGGPIGMVPICKRCDDKMERIAASSYSSMSYPAPGSKLWSL